MAGPTRLSAARCLAALALMFVLAIGACAQSVDYTVNDKGLQSLTYNGWQFIGDSSYQGLFNLWWGGPTFRRSDGSTYAGSGTVVGWAKDTSTSTTTIQYSWGWASCTYSKPTSTRLNMHVIVKNNTADTLTYNGGYTNLLIFDTPIANPNAVDSWWNSYPLGAQPRYINDLQGTPGLLVDLGSSGTMTICNDGSPHTKSIAGFLCQFNSTQRFSLYYTMGEDVPPGHTGTCDFSLRFGAAGTKLTDMAADAYERFAAIHPFRAQPSSDRRLMGSEFLSTTVPHPSNGKNPRGWFNNDDTIDVTTPAGLANFQSRILARADSDISYMNADKCQGLVVWDIEGQEYPHATSYVGDPPMLDTVAPEMAYKGNHTLCVADEFFKKFRDAGFKIGVCLRPTKFTWNGTAYYQADQPDPGQVILDKVTYCKNRWGTTLFYVDSNVDSSGGTYPPAAMFKRALDAYPDISLMGEWQSPKQYSYGPPWDSGVNDGTNQTGSAIVDLYPGAFTNIYAADVDFNARGSALLAGVKRGDMLMARIWFNDSSTTSMVNLYNQAGKRPTVSITSPANNTTLTNPASVTINATAADADGSVTKVEFFAGGIKIGEDTTSPYSLVWTGLTPGNTYCFSAKATDNSGCTTVSDPVKVTVTSALPAETIWAGRTAPSQKDSIAYELGTVFHPTVDGKITKIRAFSTNEETGVHTARIWRNYDSTVVGGPYVFLYGGENGWVTLDLPVPIGVQANVDYTVSVSTGDDTGKWYPKEVGSAVAGSDGANLAWMNGAGVYGTTLGARPTQTTGNTNYLRDVVFDPGQAAYSFFASAGPGGSTNASGEYGLRFKSSSPGRITKVRFFKVSGETGVHTGRIWSSTGTLLASAQFATETGSGWQEQPLATPLAISADTTYTVSVNSVGKYGSTTLLAGADRFTTNGPLYSVVGSFGASGSAGAYPGATSATVHYYRDVVFEPFQTLPTFGISGLVTDSTGLAIQGAQVTTSYGMSAATDTDGSYSISAPQGWTGTAVAASPDYVLTPVSRPYPAMTADVSGQDYAALPRAGNLKSIADGTPITAGPGVVTARFGSTFYIESTDRSNAIRVDATGSVTAPLLGAKVQVGGTVTTDISSGEKLLQATSLTDLGTGSVDPVGLITRAIMGGPDNLGMLVRVVGAVTEIDPTGAWFYLNDGSGISDGTGNTGLRVLADGRGYAPGRFVVVTGIATCFKGGLGELEPQVRPRSAADLNAL